MLRSTILLLVICGIGQLTDADENGDWPGFRGHGARGVSHGPEMPESWDALDGNDKSVVWKTIVPGLGHSSPVVFGDRIFLTTAISENGDAPLQVGRGGNTAAADDNGSQKWIVLCYNKSTGKEMWREVVHSGTPRATRHTKATHANASVAVNDQRVVACFGSEGCYCYDHDGNLIWERDLGVINVSKYGIGWGYASSPAIHGDHIVLVCDDPENPFLVSLNMSDGSETWRTSRKGDCERSWGTPLIHDDNGSAQIVVNGWPWIVSYELETGKERWRIAGGGDNPTPSPFAIDNKFYITNAHGGPSPIYVIDSNATGNLNEPDSQDSKHLIWKVDRGGSYMSTPVVWGDYLYLGNTNGVIRCFHATTGEKVYEERLGRQASITASLVAADDKIYCPSEEGTMYVIRAGPEFEVIAKNRMGDPCFASPAISQNTLFVRTSKSLVALRKSKQDGEESKGVDRRKPNILFIAVDDLRPSLGCYGDTHAISPNIDSLASRGVLFERAYCQVAVCNPSRASLMTGLRPDKLGVWTLPIHFRESMPDAVTIPQWFRRFGYTAVSHGKVFHNPTPDPQSWSEPIRSIPRLPDPYPEGTRELVLRSMKELPKNDWRKNNLRRPSTAAPDLPDDEVLDGARTSLAIEDIRRLGKEGEPFFLAMGFIRPHLAWVAPKKYWEMHDPRDLPVLENQVAIPDTPAYAPHNNSELSHYVDLIDMPKPWDDKELSVEKQRHLLHGYYACVTFIDAQIGRLLKTLDQENLADNTIVVLWSDHGWKLGEHRGWGKMTNYEIDARVPLIIAAPKMKTAGQRTTQLSELLDVFPTLCELAGVDVPEFVDGKSLVPILKDTGAAVRQSAMSQYYRRHEGREYMGYSMRTQEYRFIEWRDFGTGEVTARELYDHRNSLAEDVNAINDTDDSTVQSLTQQLVRSHPRKRLQMVPAVHSNPNAGRWKSDLKFENKTDTDLLVYPITPAGRRGRLRVIVPGDQTNFNARIGGVYVVESKDGTIHEIHSPSFPSRPVVIER